MKRFWKWLLVFLGFSSPLVSSCTKEEFMPIKQSDIEMQILFEVNNKRKESGLRMCRINSAISSIAKIHSQFMTDGLIVSHDNFAERVDILTCKIDAKLVGEVVAFGYGTSAGVIAGWEKSESHRKVLYGTGWTDFGVSAVQSKKGRYYFTLIFTRQ